MLSGTVLLDGLEHRQEHIVMLFEPDHNRQTNSYFRHSAADDVGKDVKLRLLDQFDRREDIRNLQFGSPGLNVDCEGCYARAARNRRGVHTIACTGGAIEQWRMLIVAAAITVTDQ